MQLSGPEAGGCCTDGVFDLADMFCDNFSGALTQAKPAVHLSEEAAAKLTDRIQNAGTEVVEAKVGIVGVVHHGVHHHASVRGWRSSLLGRCRQPAISLSQ